jgi:hypothetical protein
MTDYFEVDCEYSGNCKSKGFKCGSCKHNKNNKEDHWSPYRPYPYTIQDWEPSTPHRVKITQPCLIEEFIKHNPHMAGKPLWISCPCPKCTPRY